MDDEREHVKAPGAQVYIGGQSAGFAPGAAFHLHRDHAAALRDGGVELVAHDAEHAEPAPEPGLLAPAA